MMRGNLSLSVFDLFVLDVMDHRSFGVHYTQSRDILEKIIES